MSSAAALPAPAALQGAPRLWFRPVHPLNWSAREVLLEQEGPSRWDNVTRYIMAFIDDERLLGLLVGYRPANDPGNIDTVRCFRTLAGPAADYPDPLAALGSLPLAAEQVEAEFGGILDKLYGPGLPQRSIHPLTTDPAAARLHE